MKHKVNDRASIVTLSGAVMIAGDDGNIVVVTPRLAVQLAEQLTAAAQNASRAAAKPARRFPQPEV